MDRILKINFILSRTGEWPSGGGRIVYEYANRLSRRGHDVSIVHPGRLVIDPSALDHLKNAARYALRKIDGRYTPATWITMDPKVRLLCVPSLTERFVPDGDAVIATAWQTAEVVSRYSKAKGRGFYFIQGLETWNGPEDRVYATWKAPLRKIVPSKWLASIAGEVGEGAAYIPNGLDLETFQIETPSEQRRVNQLAMLYHSGAWKGCAEGLVALSLVRERARDARHFVWSSSTPNKPSWLDRILPLALLQAVTRNIQPHRYIRGSKQDGRLGFTGCEALLCGAALVATDIGGHREFAFHEKTALTSPVQFPAGLAENILRLIKDPGLRIQLARNGYEFVRQLTYERALSSFEEVLCAE